MVPVNCLEETTNLNADIVPIMDTIACDNSLKAIEVEALCPDQWCTYDIIVWHLDEVLKGNDPLPL